MTDDQRKQIKVAARTLELALNDVGSHFEVSVSAIKITVIEGGGKDYAYYISVKTVSEEFIV